MSRVVRLLTVVDLDDHVDVPEDGGARYVDGPPPPGAGPGLAPRGSGAAVPDPHELSCSALHQAVLDDGRRVRLLSDRGWSVHGPAEVRTSVGEIEAEARTVVGPDEPYGGRSQADMAADHWSDLAEILRRQGVEVDAEQLRRLPHEVQLSRRLRARIAGP